MSKVPQIKVFQGLPVLTSAKMKYIDNIATLEYGIKEGELMENAGSSLAMETTAFAERKTGKKKDEIKIAVFCGRGNNGADGLVCARYLKSGGIKTKVFIVSPGEKGYGKLSVENMTKAKEAGVDICLVDPDNLDIVEKESQDYDIFVDALLGISAMGKPAGVVKRLIQIINKHGKPVVAADIPSGLNPDTGHHSGVFIKAELTITFGFAKTGLMAAHAQKNIGELKVAPIGYTQEIVKRAQQ